MISFKEWCELNTDIRPLIKRLKTSLPEQYLGFYLSQTLDIPIEYNTEFSWLGHYSLDIYLPTLSLALEYDGSYYHGNRNKHDYEKSTLCAENNVVLIRIKENQDNFINNTPDIIIHYKNSNRYSNIDIAITEVFEVLNTKYAINTFPDVNLKRDHDKIVAYVQNKYYHKSMAHLWPESFLYWNENYDVTPYDQFCTDDAPLKCPRCGRTVNYFPRYHWHRRSLVPCECEYSEIEEMLRKEKQKYKETNILLTFDDSLYSRRLFDRMEQDVKYYCKKKDEFLMYEKLGFDITSKKGLIESGFYD